MDDESLVRLFEAGQVPPGRIPSLRPRPRGVVLARARLVEALARFSTALRRFAIAQGKPDLFHETITTAYLLFIERRRADWWGARRCVPR